VQFTSIVSYGPAFFAQIKKIEASLACGVTHKSQSSALGYFIHIWPKAAATGTRHLLIDNLVNHSPKLIN
jgi:hypothetical protein